MATINLDSNTADVIRNLRTEAGQAGDSTQVELCDKALDGDHDAFCECIRVVIQDGGNGPDNWSLYDESNESRDAAALGITAKQYDQALLESLTSGQSEGWIVVNGQRVYAQ